MSATQSVGGGRRLTKGALTVDIGPERETCVVRLRGELDLRSAPLLQGELNRLLSSELPAVILDLGYLEFIDSTGTRCLLTAARRSQANGDRLRILSPVGDVERILELSGVGQFLPISR
jgi:anti-sigma B factor antagonist